MNFKTLILSATLLAFTMSSSLYAQDALEVETDGDTRIYFDATVDGALSAGGDATFNAQVYVSDTIRIDNNGGNFYVGNQYSGYQISTGLDNIVIGAQALRANQTASNHVAIGRAALELSTGGSNIGVGRGAGGAVTTGARNVFVGDVASGTKVTQTESVVVGYAAGLASDTTKSIFIGAHSGRYQTQDNRFIVNNSNRTDEATENAESIIVGQMSSVVANQTLQFNAAVTVTNNTSVTGQLDVGAGAIVTGGLQSNGNGADTFVAGEGAVADGTQSVAIGENADSGTGNNNVIIGRNAAAAAGTGGQVAIGSGADSTTQGVAIGYGAINEGHRGTAVGGSANTWGQQSTAIGFGSWSGYNGTVLGAYADNNSYWQSIAIGRSAINTKDHQLMVGAIDYEIDEVHFVTLLNAPLIFDNHIDITGDVDVGGDFSIAGGQTINLISNDANLSGNATTLLTEQAVKSYTDTQITANNTALIDTNTALGTSDTVVPSQNAAKVYIDQTETDANTYTDNQIAATISTNTSLGTSDTLVPSQNAVKAYVDAQIVTPGSTAVPLRLQFYKNSGSVTQSGVAVTQNSDHVFQFTVPTGTNNLTIEAVGGGGGGGAGDDDDGGVGGGSDGGDCTVTINAGSPIIIAKGGKGGKDSDGGQNRPAADGGGDPGHGAAWMPGLKGVDSSGYVGASGGRPPNFQPFQGTGGSGGLQFGAAGSASGYGAGGGGGGGAGGSSDGAGGGGGGGWGKLNISVNPGDTIVVTIGAGGSKSGDGSGNNGSNGKSGAAIVELFE